MFQQSQIGVEAARIVQKVPAGTSESKPSRSDKLRRISQQRPETLRVTTWRKGSIRHIRIRSSDAETAGHPSIVGKRNSGIASTINDSKWGAGLIDGDAGKFPAVKEKTIHKART